MTKTKQTDEQRAVFKRAVHAGKVRHLAELNGGTGDLRGELSAKEKEKRKSRRKISKASRKKNRA